MRLESIKERLKNEEYIKRDIDFYEAHEAIEYLIQRLEKYGKALVDARTEVWNEYVPSTLSVKVHRIVEEALKE